MSKREIVCAAIVTYGSRSAECIRAAESALASGADRILIIDNGMTDPAYNQVLDWVNVQGARVSLSDRQIAVRGSAYGFGAALVGASGLGDWVWLLDDDNCPEEDALGHLREVARELPNTVLFARRSSSGVHSRVASGQNPYPAEGAFLGFDVLSRVFRNRQIGWLAPGVAKIPFGPYGGMFLSADFVKRFNLPPIGYELYVDDHRYSAGFKAAGIDLGLVVRARVNESGSKWSDGHPGGLAGVLSWTGVERGRRVLRNGVAFSLYRAGGRSLRWWVNRCVYLAALRVIAVKTMRLEEWNLTRSLFDAGEQLWREQDLEAAR